VSHFGAALEFKNVLDPKASIWSLCFSKTKRGCLGALSNTGHFKAYDIAKEYVSEDYRASLDETLGRGSSQNYPERIYTKYVRDIRGPFDHRTRGCSETERIVAFDFLNISASNEPSAIVLLGNGRVEIVTLQPPCPPVRLSSQSILACGRPHGNYDFRIKSPFSSGNVAIANIVRSIRDRALPNSFERAGLKGQLNGPTLEDNIDCLSSRENRERMFSLGRTVRVEDALTLMTLKQFRCKEGYLFDCARNKQILADDPLLQDFWDWIGRG
jgi:WD repeat-containing protein mio